MTEPTFGVVINRATSDAASPALADMSVFGFVGPAPDADPIAFPLDEAVLVYSNDATKIAKLGDGGFLKDAVRGVNGQLARMQLAGVGVIVRTAEGASSDPALKNQQTIAKVIGDQANNTGIYALLRAPDELNVTPRLIAVPGYTGVLANTVGVLNVTTPGAGYTPGATYPLTFTNGGTGAVQATGHAIANEDGGITADDVFLDTGGAWYTAAPTVTVGGTAPAGDSATAAVITATIDELANPVCAALPSVLNALVAKAVVESSGTSVANTRQWRTTVSGESLIPVNGGCKVIDPVTGNIVTRPIASRIIGLAIATDFEHDGIPTHSWANRPVYDIVGPALPLTFSIADGANEGQTLLSDGVGIISKGETGNDFSIANGGFIFIGTDTAAEDPEWQFYNVSRGRDYINLNAMRMIRTFLGRNNITGQTVQAMMNSLRLYLRDLKADNHILGYAVNFSGTSNTIAEIRAGRLKIGFVAEEPPVLRKVTVSSGRMSSALDSMVAQLASQLNTDDLAA
jgi:phage tail sheath protein FI